MSDDGIRIHVTPGATEYIEEMGSNVDWVIDLTLANVNRHVAQAMVQTFDAPNGTMRLGIVVTPRREASFYFCTEPELDLMCMKSGLPTIRSVYQKEIKEAARRKKAKRKASGKARKRNRR